MLRRFVRRCSPGVLSLSVLVSGVALAQGFGSPPLGEGPWELQTAQTKIQVSVVARGLVHPWSVAFLPNGDMLVTEREGRLRLIHEGVLDPEPISGVPAVDATGLLGLMDVLPHPEFAQNNIVYLTYSKLVKPAAESAEKEVATTLVRARLDGKALVDVEELLASDTWNGAGGAGARIVFGNDGKLYMGVFAGITEITSASAIAQLNA